MTAMGDFPTTGGTRTTQSAEISDSTFLQVQANVLRSVLSAQKIANLARQLANRRDTRPGEQTRASLVPARVARYLNNGSPFGRFHCFLSMEPEEMTNRKYTRVSVMRTD